MRRRTKITIEDKTAAKDRRSMKNLEGRSCGVAFLTRLATPRLAAGRTRWMVDRGFGLTGVFGAKIF